MSQDLRNHIGDWKVDFVSRECGMICLWDDLSICRWGEIK